jgi:hypothetical protein
VEKLPVLTLSSRPLTLNASVDPFNRDIMLLVAGDVADFFNNDWNDRKRGKSENPVDAFLRQQFRDFNKHFTPAMQSTNKQIFAHNGNQFQSASHLSVSPWKLS